MLESWNWQEYKDFKTHLEGFVGENQQARVYLTLNTKKATGVWYQTIEFKAGIVGALEKKDNELNAPKWLSTKSVLLFVPQEWWPKVANLTQKCYEKSLQSYEETLETVMEELHDLKSPDEIFIEQELGNQSNKLKDLRARSKALSQIAEGKLDPGQWDEDGKIGSAKNNKHKHWKN